jgi:hypothetical protein
VLVLLGAIILLRNRRRRGRSVGEGGTTYAAPSPAPAPSQGYDASIRPYAGMSEKETPANMLELDHANTTDRDIKVFGKGDIHPNVAGLSSSPITQRFDRAELNG